MTGTRTGTGTRTRFWLFGLLGAGAAIRSWQLGARSLWFDEAVSATSVSRFGWWEMIERTGAAVHPPLYYLVLRCWTLVFGLSEVALRSLSVVLATLTMWGIYLFCRDAFRAGFGDGTDVVESEDRLAALVSVALLAVSASHIDWAQHARMYMLGTCLAAFGSWCLVRGLSREGRSHSRWWFGWMLCGIGLCYTHNYGLFTVLAQCLFAGGVLVARKRLDGMGGQCESRSGSPTSARPRCRATRGFILGMFGMTAAYAPWLPVLRQQSERVRADYWIGRFHGWTLPNAWCDLFVPRNDGTAAPSWLSGSVAALTLAALILLVRQRPLGGALVGLLVLVPVGVAGAVSAVSSPIVVSRYFVFAHLFAVAGIGQVLWRCLRHEARLFGISVALLLSVTIWLEYRDQLAVDERPGLREVVRAVVTQRTDDEPILVVHPAIFHAARYHANGAVPVSLYATQPLSHYNGGPLLVAGDVWDEAALNRYPGETVWVLDTTGFRTSFVRFALPSDWQRMAGTENEAAEVYSFQGEIMAGRFVRTATRSAAR